MPEIRRIDSGKIACIEAKGSYFDLAALYAQLKEFFDFRRVSFKTEPFAIIYETAGPRDLAHLHFAAGFELAGETLGDGEVIIITRSTGWVACELHRGPYAGLEETHQRLKQWITTQGFRITGPAYEYFLGGVVPGGGAAPAEAAVEVQFPVEKVEA
jgi:effector-binding domain-containing protein